jgi:hypothetical protein
VRPPRAGVYGCVMRLRAASSAAAVLLLAAGCGAGSAPNAPQRALAEDDQRWAEGALPTPGVAPEGWDVGADDRGAALDDCVPIDLSDLRLRGEAVGTYKGGERILALAGTQVFATEEEASAALERGDDDAWSRCAAEEVAEAFTSEDEGVAEAEARVVAPPDAGDEARAAEVTGVYVAGDLRLDGQFELVKVRSGRGLLTLATAGLGEPFPADVRDALVEDFARRSAAKPPPP